MTHSSSDTASYESAHRRRKKAPRRSVRLSRRYGDDVQEAAQIPQAPRAGAFARALAARCGLESDPAFSGSEPNRLPRAGYNPCRGEGGSMALRALTATLVAALSVATATAVASGIVTAGFRNPTLEVNAK